MSVEVKKPAFKVGADAGVPEILTKINDFVGGDRTEEEQIELVASGLVVFVDMLRSLQGDKMTQCFLESAIKEIGRSKKQRFVLQSVDKRLSH